jgi:hypothetical protein
MRSRSSLFCFLPLFSFVGAAPQSSPTTGDNGEMGGIFGMGISMQVPKGFEGIANGLSGLLGKLGGSLGGLASSVDLTSIIPAGPEYPKGKMSLAEYYSPGSGPYSAHLLTEPSLPNHVIYAPKVPPPEKVKMPVLIWGNGGCTSSGTPYGPFLTEVASYGYIAIANGPPGGAPPSLDVPSGLPLPGPNGEQLYSKESMMGGGMSKVKDMLDAIDWVVKGNAKKFGNVDTDTFITAGSSCGGLEAYSAAYKNPKVKLIGIYNSGVINAQKVPLLKELKAMVAYFEGGPLDMGYQNVSHRSRLYP